MDAKWITSVDLVDAQRSDYSSLDATVSAADGEQTSKDNGAAIVVTIGLETEEIRVHILPPAAVVPQFTVHLDDLLWQQSRLRADDCTIAVSTRVAASSLEDLHGWALNRRYSREITMLNEPMEAVDAIEEALHKLLAPSGRANFQQARSMMAAHVLRALSDCVYAVLDQFGDFLQNAKYESAFTLTIEYHNEPVRPTMRLNEATRGLLTSKSRDGSQSVFKALQRHCRTKRGRHHMQQRMERPSVDVEEIRARHDLLEQLLHVAQTVDAAATLVRLLDCAAEGETQFQWFCSDTKSPTLAPTLQLFLAWCTWIKRLQSHCAEFADSTSASTAAHLQQRLISPICNLINTQLRPFAVDATNRIQSFYSDSSTSSTEVTALRRQATACEQAIQQHRTEIATALLLKPERVKIVYEDDDISTARSRATSPPSVLFRVTRQDGHRVFQADKTLVNLVYSRRTTGVWFSTPMLDTLATQRRILQLAIATLEEQLIQTLTQAFSHTVRPALTHLLAHVAGLDVLAAFAQITVRYKYTRPVVSADDDRAIEIHQLRGPLDDPQPSTRVVRFGVDTYPLLAIHSAIEHDHHTLAQLAVTVLLSQIGCFVPCQSARLPVVDALCGRWGAVDHTLAHASTFFTEMQQISDILARVTSHSLVLIDDLCRGTAATEGLPLAVEICRHLIHHRVPTCVATQWTELLDELLALDQSTVPSVNPSEAVSTSKRAYRSQVLASDAKFLDRLQALDFPNDLVDLVRRNLNEPS